MKLRKLMGKFTSPIFVPLRKLVVWSDNKFGTCDYKLSLEPRVIQENNTYEGEIHVKEISELMKKVSKDRAELESLILDEIT